LLAVALSALVFTASCARPDKAASLSSAEPPSVAVQTVSRATLAHSVSLTAEFIPYQEVDVMAKVAGYVRHINVDIGDRVHTGQILATLEVPELNDDLSRAAATVQRSQAEVQNAAGNVSRAEAAHQIAHLSYTRLAEVAQQKPGLVAQQEIDEAHSKDLEAEAQVAASKSTEQAAEQQREASTAEQSRAKTLLAYSLVTAPFNGVITKRYANTGSMIQAGTASQTQAMPVARLAQNDLLRLMLPVPESAVSRIRIGQPVEVHVSSLSRTFQGKVTRFADTVATATRTMETEVDVPNPKYVLIPGMYADVELQLESRPDALSIPVTAVEQSASDNEPSHVYTVDASGTVQVVPVRLGLETANRVEVLSGLEPGQYVIVGARSGLKPGDKVKPQVVQLPEAKDSNS
jgi:RND family efflux transporter MFP subunit